MRKINHIKELSKQEEGKWIKLGGQGIIDGLKNIKYTNRLLKVIEVKENKIILKRYGAHNKSILPKRNWNQEAQILSDKDYQELEYY